jgi:glycosyltransferase involved in cell wall biosynthesis
MRICIVTHDLQRTIGQGRINYELGYHLAQRGHEVVLISETLTPPLKGAPNVTWREIRMPAWVRGNLARFQLFATGARQALVSDPVGFDIVQLNGFVTDYPSDVNVSMFIHAQWTRSPFYSWRSANAAYGLYQRLFTRWHVAQERKAYHASRHVVALSGLVQESLISDVGLTRDRISVISPGVDTNEFRPLHPDEPDLLRTELNVPENAFLVFFAGEIKSNRKNLDLTLHALSRLGSETHLAVAGATAGSPYPEMARQLRIADRVHFLGHREDVPTLLRGADAFAFASHYDPYALVILEAMASGVPVITAPSVGACTLLRDGWNGFVLRDSGDLEGMVGALRRLVADRDFAARLGRAGRATAEGASWAAMTSDYEALYEQLVDEKRRQGSSPAPLLAGRR